MKNCKNGNNCGRTMVEMLGVLAVIGVLSVGGFASYHKAMNSYKVNKTIEQINTIATNIIDAYADRDKYEDLNPSTSLQKAQIIPSSMVKNGNIKNAYGGNIVIDVSGSDGGAFNLWFGGDGSASMPQDACIALLSFDWGSVARGNLIGIEVNDASPDVTSTSCSSSSRVFCGIQDISFEDAMKACSNSTNNKMAFIFR